MLSRTPCFSESFSKMTLPKCEFFLRNFAYMESCLDVSGITLPFGRVSLTSLVESMQKAMISLKAHAFCRFWRKHAVLGSIAIEKILMRAFERW